ncbi:MAG TPA: acyltransferase, partial [Puia sp.]|nr:acyltransferase [Puia sp.]
MIAQASEKRPSLLEHKPQLDGARFCAVFVVLIYHHFGALQGQNKFFDLTTFIVFFFVLSGYLITKILIVAKDVGLQQGQTRINIAFDFLFRRTLRIFPAYYFYLIMIMILLPVGGMYLRDHAAMFFLYLSNFQIYSDQLWERFATPHLWTLAVEEQFYVMWPWLILFIPNKHLPKLFSAL